MFQILYQSAFTLSLLLLITGASYAQVKVPEEIIYGTVYNIFHDRYNTDQEFFDQTKRDMANIKKANLNLVMPFPLGEWDNVNKIQSWVRTDYLVNQIEENELKMMPIMLKTNSRNWIPLWKLLEIEDSVREDPTGIKGRTGGIYNMKYQHPEIKEVFEEYVKSLTGRYKNSPAMFGYNLWNEAHYFSIDEITIPKYREWLKNKYGTLTELNRVWGRDYSHWDEIDPVQKGKWTSSMPDIDLELFRHDNNADIAKWTTKTLRKYDTEHWVNINTCQSMLSYFRGDIYSVDEWIMAPLTDVFGISMYPDEWERWTSKGKDSHPHWRMSMIYNAIRCASKDKPYIISEMQTNMQTGLRIEKALSYDDLYLRTWIAFANDCKGIVYWKWMPFLRGQQSFGRGLTQTDGKLSERGQAVQDVGLVLNKYGGLLYNAKIEPAQTAILWDIIGYYKSSETTHKAQMFFNDSYEGMYKALWEENISVDIVRTDKPLTLEDLIKYKIIFMPFQVVVAKETAGLLSEYVHKGGWLVADARTATIDNYDFGYPVNPGAGLDQVFGVRRMDWLGRDESIMVTVSENSFFDGYFNNSLELEGKWYKEKVVALDGASILATFNEDDTPAIVLNKYGEGKAILAAFPLSGSYRLTKDENIQKFLVTLAGMAEVQPDAKLETNKPTKKCMIKVHQVKDKRLIYVCNTSGEAVSGEINIPVISTELKKAKEIISKRDIILNKKSGKYSFPIHLLPKKTAVYLLE